MRISFLSNPLNGQMTLPIAPPTVSLIRRKVVQSIGKALWTSESTIPTATALPGSTALRVASCPHDWSSSAPHLVLCRDFFVRLNRRTVNRVAPSRAPSHIGGRHRRAGGGQACDMRMAAEAQCRRSRQDGCDGPQSWRTRLHRVVGPDDLSRKACHPTGSGPAHPQTADRLSLFA